jgi:hypothetical protein
MFAIIAAIIYGVGFLIAGSATHVNGWFAPIPLLLLGSFCLALHLAGVGTGWTVRRP